MTLICFSWWWLTLIIFFSILGIGEFREGYKEEDLPITYNVTVGKPYELKCPPHSHMPGQIYTWAVPPLEFWKTGYPTERVFQSEKHGSLFFTYVTKDDIDRIKRKEGLACILYNDYTSTIVSTQINLRSDLKGKVLSEKWPMRGAVPSTGITLIRFGHILLCKISMNKFLGIGSGNLCQEIDILSEKNYPQRIYPK